MTITDHILVVVSFRQALHYDKALWSKNFPPPDFKDLDRWERWERYQDHSAVTEKLLTWFCDCLQKTLPLALMHTVCQTQLLSRHLTCFCFLNVPLKGNGEGMLLCVRVPLQPRAVPMCDVCAVHVRHHGWDGYGNMERLYCSEACPWRCCHW